MVSLADILAVCLASTPFLGYADAGVIDFRSSLAKRANADGGPRVAVLGDSYGSGLAFLDSNRYKGNNDDGCYRWTEAYAAQLERDEGNFLGPVDMQFVACTGNRLVNMARENPQIAKVSGDVDLVVLTVGGNDARFYGVASNCIFHDKFPHDYGAPYPDETGECSKSINAASNYIKSTVQGPGLSLDFDIRQTYDDLLAQDAYKNLPRTYHTGYINLFNAESEGDWCEASKESFGLIPFIEQQPTLTLEVRSRINAMVQDFNNVLKKVTADYADKKFSYLEISDRFEGHRFCESGSNHFNQYYDSNVWFWNVSPPLPEDVVVTELQTFPDELAKVYKTGLWNTTTTEDRDFFPQSGTTGAGWTLRPMHPKKDGYAAIKDAIVEKMKEDNIGV